MMRSTLRRPVSLSSSYLTFEPSGISMTAWKSRGTSGPGETSCHAWSKVTCLEQRVELNKILSPDRAQRGQCCEQAFAITMFAEIVIETCVAFFGARDRCKTS